MNKNLVILLFAFVLLLSLGCEREDPEFRTFSKSTGVFIINEGNFTYGNASLSFLDLTTGEIDNQVFYKANGFPLGDVAFSMTISDSMAFISINNSGKIFSVNTRTFKHQGTIAGLSSPRYIQLISKTKAYISDLYSTSILVFDPGSLQITDTIETGRSTEQMVVWNDYVFATCWSFGNEVLKINTLTNQVEDSIRVNNQPNSMVIDKNNNLWVLSDGGYEGSPLGVDYPALTVIDPDKMDVLTTVLFPNISGSPNNLLINGSRDSIFFLYGSWTGETDFDSGAYRMSVNSNELPDDPFIPEKNRLYYRMGIDPVYSTIYISDALDYMQKGFVFRFTPDGALIDSMRADRIPGFFAFMTE
ncbi:MAG: YncE family protein [Bacteroidetes bacterium]|nr:YncE family protein [Bacteroidota bacterium]MBT3750687.1 YncE family protein [Bacteroidota bacterium]MBT4401471.1 YncE family protein [Bacteroidota bacterium]MBT4408407.1 YncE family protein [Bacteroidota bacterium]MBT5425017.1 YncE family protein [Bacteroidota bacterium]